ncbi:MAG: YezD family protein [Methylothermaceae bacterium]|nr:YezD family protein [Methylothermaceae bacterium]
MPQKLRTADIEDKHAFPPPVLAKILETLKDIHYGAVEIVVHDGRVVQIERREKFRFEPAAAGRNR